MSGKTVLITGATSGLGLATALLLAEQGAEVVMVGRDRTRGNSMRAEIAKCVAGSVTILFLADLSSQAEIHRLAEKLHGSFSRIDVLINNAAAMFADSGRENLALMDKPPPQAGQHRLKMISRARCSARPARQGGRNRAGCGVPRFGYAQLHRRHGTFRRCWSWTDVGDGNVRDASGSENEGPKRGVSGWYGDCHKLLGDRWSLLILHNMVLRKINSFTELLESGEGIATNVLSDRLKKFLAKGIITVRPHDSDRRKLNYALTAKGKALEPVLAEMVLWNAKYLPRRTREKGRRDRKYETTFYP